MGDKLIGFSILTIIASIIFCFYFKEQNGKLITENKTLSDENYALSIANSSLKQENDKCNLSFQYYREGNTAN